MAKETLRHQKNPETKFKICLTPSPHAPPRVRAPGVRRENGPKPRHFNIFNDFFYEDI